MDASISTPITSPWWLQPRYLPWTRRGVTVVAGVFTVGTLGWLGLPFEGSFLRVQANYRPIPKINLNLDVQEASVAGKPALGLFGTMKRVWNEEGWAWGFQRGIWEFRSWYVLLYVVGVMFIPPDVALGEDNGPLMTGIPDIGPRVLLRIIASTLVILPLQVSCIRRVLAPYRTGTQTHSSSAPRKSPRNLQSITRHFLSLYRIPGLLLAVFFFIALPYVGNAVEVLIFPERKAQRFMWSYLGMGWDVVRRGALVAVIRLALDLSIAKPLDNLIVRLSTQEADWKMEEDDGEPDEKIIDASSPTLTPLVRFRTGRPPYEGLLDAAKTIVREEGWPPLFLTWEWAFPSFLVNLIL
ncbi:hypothetical protein BDY24DRAFT_439013 [Mrakia frigida]|uniref:uncharacterized protein n=1 Tax=Mrakia frigida TaxID=29902 RepID=UPI003FCC104A